MKTTPFAVTLIAVMAWETTHATAEVDPSPIPTTPQTAAEAGIADTELPATDGGLPGNRPDPDLPGVTTAITVDWPQPIGTITPEHWGVCLFTIVGSVEQATDPGYADFLGELQPGFIRIHHSKMSQRWTDEQTRDWDVEKMRQSLAILERVPDAKVMICLPAWPTWLNDSSKLLPPEKYDEAERLVRGWVRAVRQASPVEVTHFEVFNEFDNTWTKAGRYDELPGLFVRMARAVREEAPDAKVGGPAFTWPKPEWVDLFLDEAGQEIDFITWHNYAAGAITTPNVKVLDAPDNLRGHAGDMLGWLEERGLEHVETYLNEYNVKWSWKPYERRHANQIGSLMQAGVITRLAKMGVTGLAVWHAKGDAYGLIDGDNRMRNPGKMFLLGRELLVGAIASEKVSGSEDVDALAVTSEDGHRSLLILNRGESPVSLPTAQELLGRPDRVSIVTHLLDADGWTVAEPVPDQERITLGGWSLMILTEAPSRYNASLGTRQLEGQDVEFSF